MLKFFKKTDNNAEIKSHCKISIKEYESIISTLTPSEKKVYNEMIQGFNATETANRLSLKKSTVDSYLKTIYKKLNVHSIVEMITSYGNTFNYINNVNTEE